MLKEKYIKSLTRHEGRKGKVLSWVMIIAPIFMILMASLNLWLASRIGSSGNYNLSDFARVLLGKIDVNRNYTYTGIFLKGLSTFNTSLVQFSVAILILPITWSYYFQRKKDTEILELLRKHDEA